MNETLSMIWKFLFYAVWTLWRIVWIICEFCMLEMNEKFAKILFKYVSWYLYDLMQCYEKYSRTISMYKHHNDLYFSQYSTKQSNALFDQSYVLFVMLIFFDKIQRTNQLHIWINRSSIQIFKAKRPFNRLSPWINRLTLKKCLILTSSSKQIIDCLKCVLEITAVSRRWFCRFQLP